MGKLIITNMDRLVSVHNEEHEGYAYDKYNVTDSKEKYEVASPAQGNQTVVAFYSIPPHKSNYPFHYHSTNEEVFYIISGQGTLETSTGTTQVTAGDIIVCPVGEEGAHKLTNASDTENLVYLDVDTNHTPDIAFYPHSQKLGVRLKGFRENYKLESGVDYWEGE